MSAEHVGAAAAWGEESSDAELITAARAAGARPRSVRSTSGTRAPPGPSPASTHAPAPTPRTSSSDAFARVYSIVRGGGGPDVAFRAYLFTVVRRLAHSRVEAGRRVQPTDDMATFESAFGSVSGVDDPALAGFERGVVAKAYGSLPERWQAVLWYTEIERLQPAQVAPLLGLTANGVAALAYRAREGLREAYLQQHLGHRADRHLPDRQRQARARTCAAGWRSVRPRRCGRTWRPARPAASLVLELGDVNHGLRGIIAPLVLGVAGLGALAAPLPVGVLASVGVGAGVGAGVGGGAAGTGVRRRRGAGRGGGRRRERWAPGGATSARRRPARPVRAGTRAPPDRVAAGCHGGAAWPGAAVARALAATVAGTSVAGVDSWPGGSPASAAGAHALAGGAVAGTTSPGRPLRRDHGAGTAGARGGRGDVAGAGTAGAVGAWHDRAGPGRPAATRGRGHRGRRGAVPGPVPP